MNESLKITRDLQEENLKLKAKNKDLKNRLNVRKNYSANRELNIKEIDATIRLIEVDEEIKIKYEEDEIEDGARSPGL